MGQESAILTGDYPSESAGRQELAPAVAQSGHHLRRGCVRVVLGAQHASGGLRMARSSRNASDTLGYQTPSPTVQWTA